MANIEERRPTAEVCPRTTSLQPIHKRPVYSPGNAQLYVCIRPCRHYTENTDFAPIEEILTSAIVRLSVCYPTNQVRANPTNTQVSLFHLRNRECDKQLNISWNCVNFTHCNPQVYLGFTLDRTLSYKA